MEKKVKVFGIEGNKTINSWREKFDCVYNNGDNALYVSKQEFEGGEEEVQDFHYKYAIECFEYETNKWCYALSLVVMPSYCNKEFLSSVASCGCIDENEVEVMDIIQHGGGSVQFGCETFEADELNEDVLTDIANVFETMDSLRGFYLDKAWNGIGSNGWDTLNHCINGEDLLKPAMLRMKEQENDK